MPKTLDAKTPRRNRRDVLTAALELLNERGLPDLTMRALARELDLQPSALYWHFANKQELLAAVADEIVGGVAELAPDASPTAIATAFRAAMLEVTDGAEVVISTIALGLGADLVYERLQRALAQGRSDTVATSVATTLLHYCLGHTSHEQQRAQAARLGVDVAASAIRADADSFRDGVSRILAA